MPVNDIILTDQIYACSQKAREYRDAASELEIQRAEGFPVFTTRDGIEFYVVAHRYGDEFIVGWMTDDKHEEHTMRDDAHDILVEEDDRSPDCPGLAGPTDALYGKPYDGHIEYHEVPEWGDPSRWYGDDGDDDDRPSCYRRGEPEDYRRLADAYDMAADAWGWLDAFPVGACVLCDGHEYTVAGYGCDTPAGVVPGLQLVRPGRNLAIAMNFDHAMEGCSHDDLHLFAEALEGVEVMPDHGSLVLVSGMFIICGSVVRMSDVLGEITCAPYDFSSFSKTPVWITLRDHHQGYADAHPDHTSAELWTGDVSHPNAEGSYAIECNVRFTNGAF